MPTLPIVGGSADTWGGTLNAYLTAITPANPGEEVAGGLGGALIAPSGRINAKAYGAKGDGVTADAVALASALSAAAATASVYYYATGGGMEVYVPPGVYMIGSLLDVPNYVTLVGAGRGLTVFKCTAAGAGIRFGSNLAGSAGVGRIAGRSGGFMVDGNSVANQPLQFGLSDGGGYDDFRVINALQDGMLVSATQNTHFRDFEIVDCGRDGIRVDKGAGSCVFSNHWIGRMGVSWVHILQSAVRVAGDQTGYTEPRSNVFEHAIYEYVPKAGGAQTATRMLWHDAGTMNEFRDVDIVGWDAISALSIVYMRKAGAEASDGLRLETCRVSGNQTWSTGFDIGSGCTVYLIGDTESSFLLRRYYMADSGIVYKVGPVRGTNVTTEFTTAGVNGYTIGRVVRGVDWMEGSAAWTPGAVAAGAQTTTTVQVVGDQAGSGPVLGDLVTASFSGDLLGCQMTAYVSAADTVTVVLRNGTAGSVTPAAGTLRARILRKL